VGRARRRGVVLREATAGLLFFGALVGRADLERAGAGAVAELHARGYAPITAPAGVRVYPLESGADAEPGQAARWRPGVVALRPEPAGGETAAVYLRHELMHEASFRTCGGRLPPWAEEAAAIAFSGETLVSGDVSEEELAHLRATARVGATDVASYRTIRALVALHGWPAAPCAQSEAIAALMAPRGGAEALTSVVVSVASGRVLEASGDDEPLPPGSVLKLPYAAALDADDPDRVGELLARSDTDALLALRAAFQLDRFVRLLAPIAEARRRLPASLDDATWRSLLGERTPDGGFPVQATPVELALVVRASLLARPDAFAGLARNGSIPGSTLEGAPTEALDAVRRLRALAKTGTISSAQGAPIAGHLVLAWPAERPRFVAVLRRRGVRGAGVLGPARERLERWRRTFAPDDAEVRVRLFALLDARDVALAEPCPGLDVARDAPGRTTTCGELRFTTDAPGARPERVVRGIVERPNGQVVLVTDVESYADAVLDAEAADLRGAARAALRAVVVWNGVHGADRHPEDRALCDTTHCMVFRGLPPDAPASHDPPVEAALLRYLDEAARARSEPWLPFSKGGTTAWSRRIAAATLARIVREPLVLAVARERTRTGDVTFHLTYSEGVETLSCDALRNALALPSCPARVVREDDAWRFEGTGEGHGLGLDVERARRLASEGRSALEILHDAYAPAAASGG
jgi:hypothetical protein